MMLTRYDTAGKSPEMLKRLRYLALVTALDDLVGKTVRSLKMAKLYDNTIIVFTSDVSCYTVQIQGLKVEITLRWIQTSPIVGLTKLIPILTRKPANATY